MFVAASKWVVSLWQQEELMRVYDILQILHSHPEILFQRLLVQRRHQIANYSNSAGSLALLGR